VLAVRDLARAQIFYGRVIGLPERKNLGVPGDVWFECANGLTIGLSPAETGRSDPCSDTRLLVRVDDLSAVGRRLLDAGTRVDPPDISGDRVVAWDPDGNRLYLVEGRGVAPAMSSRTKVSNNQLHVTEEAHTRGTPSEVWIALVDPALLSAWLSGGPAQIEPGPGGRMSLTFPHVGRPHTTWKCQILDFVPPARLRFREEILGLEVAFDLAPIESRRTMIRLSMAPIDLSMLGDDAKSAASNLALNWRRILRNLVLLMDDELDPAEPDKGGRPG